ncbi:polysaccharide pyruvyl transferase family protein [Luteimonas salinilitoris]|uniref:Polysaccharide pyruvyl transferase family protein n=1 Tax=Luteimonas salinilitoris TaxID=3237697 RepID=A0ABV4HPL5_9GAMM
MRNFGDDLFGAICTAAASRFWNARPRVVGPAIDGVDARYTMPSWYPPAVYGASNVLGRASRMYSFARGLHGTDVLVMGGGSVITGRGSFREPLMLSARRRGRLQLAALGVSIGPFDDAATQDSAAAFIRQFSYIAVRDRRSYELAVAMGVGDRTHHGRDLAGLLPLLLTPPARPPLPVPGQTLRIGLAPCNHLPRPGYPTPEPTALQSSLAEALVQLNRRYRVQAEVFSLNDHPIHGDLRLTCALQQELSARGLTARQVRYRRSDPVATARAIAGCDAFISTRLHGAIVAYLLGVPFMIVDYHPKCVDFADDIGLPGSRRITARRHDAAAIGDGMGSMLDAGDAPTFPRDVYARQAQEIFQRAPWATAGAAS